MRKSKNSTTLGFMISSIGLLIVLQALWLQNSYEKAFLDMRRESGILLRSTIFDLRDSMFARNIEAIDPDSMRGNAFFTRSDSFNVKLKSPDRLAFDSRVEIIVSSGAKPDSGVNFLSPLASSLHKMGGRRNFVVRMGPDSLNMDTLTYHYQKTLKQAGMESHFIMRHLRVLKPHWGVVGIRMPDDPDIPEKITKVNIYDDTLVTERTRLNPMHQYIAVFPGVRIAILKEIAPQILFSLFLTSMIVLSFVLVYRSLLSQQRLNELKNDFISNVTHELKTPVATVSVALEALKDFHALSNPERTQEYLSIAQNELNRLTLMTDKILKASVFEAKGVSLVYKKTNLHTVIQQVLESMKIVFEKRQIQVSYTPTGSDFMVLGSEVHLTNVIYNLLDNAVKYGKDNGVIDIGLKNTPGELVLTVRDNGIGIAKPFQKKVFEKFFRVPSGDVHNVKGYGLGLNYVAGVIKGHKGTIEVESDEDNGSLFTIKLPRGN